jgi:glucose-6-phosphate isomerase
MTNNRYDQAIDGVFTGAAGLERGRYEVLLSEAKPALARIAQKVASGALPHLALARETADLAGLADAVKLLRHDTTDVVLLGTGGSSLGAQAIAALRHVAFTADPAAPRMRFLDNLDPASLDQVLAHADLRTTRFLVVSKSGGTAETLTQMLVALGAIEKAGGFKWVSQHFVVVVEPGDNPLRRLANRHQLMTLDHDPKLGGRYSVLSLVGLLPALVLGLDAAAVRKGAAEIVDQALSATDPATVPAAVGAALSVGLAERGVSQTVMLAYADRLERFAAWWRQLWAESLGKHGKGTTPVPALMPVDQHSQLQLYLDGPNDKLFTVISTDTRGRGPVVPAAFADDPALDYLRGRTIGDLVSAQVRGTTETLIERGRPTRTLRVPHLDEAALGALFAHFTLETLIAADLLGVDPFDQPAVEDGKVKARRYLAEIPPQA